MDVYRNIAVIFMVGVAVNGGVAVIFVVGVAVLSRVAVIGVVGVRVLRVVVTRISVNMVCHEDSLG